jgi:hypothetical protein
MDANHSSRDRGSNNTAGKRNLKYNKKWEGKSKIICWLDSYNFPRNKYLSC